MKSHILFFLVGIVLGAAIFWLPTALAGGNSFALLSILVGPWYLAAIPYLVVFAFIFGLLMVIYGLLKKHFPVSLTDGAWMLLGLYLALTFFFHVIGIATSAGNLTL
jgi:hypothetical protein